jgi:acyl-CoA synthetase (AMP-forming)/AMP-acid ligase II
VSSNPAQAAASAYSYPLLIRHLLHTPLATAPHQEIVYADRQRYDYITFMDRIARLASALEAVGVEAGDTVAVMDWDSHRYLECFFAVPMMGAVLHTINVRLAPDQILYTINHAEDDVILVNQDFLPIVEQIRDRLERPCELVLIREGVDAPATPLDLEGEYEQLVAQVRGGYEFHDFDEHTRATTFYTTGTTGNPKGVFYSHRQLVLHTLANAAEMGIAGAQGHVCRDDVYMPITPMFHVHAWGHPYVSTLFGMKQVYPGRYDPESLLELIEREKVTYSHCVPTILHMLLSCPKADSVDLSNWKVVIGGSAMPRGLARAALDRGIDVFAGYGMSETGPVLTVAHLERAMLDGDDDEVLELRCRSGRPLPLVDLDIVDENMQSVPRDGKSTGEIVVRSPSLTQGYFKDAGASEALWSGGYLHTGDIGCIDEQGYLKVTDRLKDVIKSGGEWISSLLLEDIISQLPGVAEVAAIGVPDEKWGERPVVLVVLHQDHDNTIDDNIIRQHVQSHADCGEISTWAIPEDIKIVTTIDKTSVGKIDKKSLRARYTPK